VWPPGKRIASASKPKFEVIFKRGDVRWTLNRDVRLSAAQSETNLAVNRAVAKNAMHDEAKTSDAPHLSFYGK
jgi:hypothetical protein